MDFSNGALRFGAPSSSLSTDTMDHAKMVMACRFGWSATPEDGMQTNFTPQTALVPAPLSTSSNDTRTRRFQPCRGRLYHQLSCSHRIRTDIVEDCGTNCLEPLNTTSEPPFYCHECVEAEAQKIWGDRETQHNATYPPMDSMDKEQYEQWYMEHRQLQAEFAKDCKIYELELRAKTRPSNVCSLTEASKEDMDFAAELDSLSLALTTSNDTVTTTTGVLQTRTNRTSLPYDASEQLHWGLNALALDRGSCGVEYSANQLTAGPSIPRIISKEELWRKPRTNDR